jgi:hypothetical protein
MKLLKAQIESNEVINRISGVTHATIFDNNITVEFYPFADVLLREAQQQFSITESVLTNCMASPTTRARQYS